MNLKKNPQSCCNTFVDPLGVVNLLLKTYVVVVLCSISLAALTLD